MYNVYIVNQPVICTPRSHVSDSALYFIHTACFPEHLSPNGLKSLSSVSGAPLIESDMLFIHSFVACLFPMLKADM